MEPLEEVIRAVVLLAFVFLLPHVPAVVGGFVPTRPVPALARALFIVAPALLYFIIMRYLFTQAADDIRAHGGYVCGAFGAMAVFTIIGGTALHVFIGAAIQSVHAVVLRRQRRPSGLT